MLPSSTTTAPSGRVDPIDAARVSTHVERAQRLIRPAGGRRQEGVSRGVERFGQRLERRRRVFARTGQGVHTAALWDEVARLLRIGEERDGRGGVDQHQVTHGLELVLCHLGEVAEAVDRFGTPGPAARASPGTSRPVARHLRRRPPDSPPSDRPPAMRCLPGAKPPSHPNGAPWPRRRPRPVARGRDAPGVGASRVPGPTRTTRNPREGPGSRRILAGRRRRPPPQRCRPLRRRASPCGGTSPRRYGRRTRCRTRGARRIGWGRSHGRRPRSPQACGLDARCAGWPARSPVPVRGVAGWPQDALPHGRTRRLRPWPRPRRGRARPAWPALRRERPRNAFPRCRDWRSTGRHSSQ